MFSIFLVDNELITYTINSSALTTATLQNRSRIHIPILSTMLYCDIQIRLPKNSKIESLVETMVSEVQCISNGVTIALHLALEIITSRGFL